MSHTAIPTAATYTITGRVLQPTLGAPMADASAVQLDPNTGKLPPGIVPMALETRAAMAAMGERVEATETAVEQFAAGAPGGVQRALRTVTAAAWREPGAARSPSRSKRTAA